MNLPHHQVYCVVEKKNRRKSHLLVDDNRISFLGIQKANYIQLYGSKFLFIRTPHPEIYANFFLAR
jgi:hypothetical protein